MGYVECNLCSLELFQHPGRGIDVRRRKIWDMYGPQTRLEVLALLTCFFLTVFPLW